MKQQKSNEEDLNRPSGINAGGDASNVSITGDGNVVNIGNTGDPQPGSSKKKTAKKSSPSRKPSSKWETAIVVALIALAGTIVTVVAPLIDKRIPTPTPAPSSTLVVNTSVPSAAITSAPEATPATLPPTLTWTLPPASATPTSLVETMTAFLQASMTEGKAPLNVNFDARASTFRFANGAAVPCGDSLLCSFTFTVYFNSKAQVTVDNKSGVYSHPFNTKGEYFVTLYVCRGTVCDDDGLVVTIR